MGKTGVLALPARFMRRLQVGHEGDSGLHDEGRLGWEGSLLLSILEKQNGFPRVSERVLSLWRTAFHPFERARQPLPHSPPPSSGSSSFSSVEPLLAAQATRAICVLREGVAPRPQLRFLEVLRHRR